MNGFRYQIDSDLQEYVTKFWYISNIKKPEWAFNFWILDNLFHEDEELIEEKIIDYNDKGIDCFEVYEDTKEVYLIQNKYYSEDTSLSGDYVKNDFLLRGITALENGTYTRSTELQCFFNRLKNDPEFTVYLQLFVTNNKHCNEADNYVKEFNRKHSNYIASIFYLDDIKEKYYGEVEENHQNISVSIESVCKGTILNLNSEAYKLQSILDARYVFAPVASIYKMFREALERQYPIFDKNIREYLGNRGINKRIYETLNDPNDRKNFFYYNNGITLICSSMTKIDTRPSIYGMNAVFSVENPQIVNGCQTVNSIYESLKNIPPSDLEREFKDTFVMLKILVIDRTSAEERHLYENIVKYNNTQNKIDEKTFAANTAIFQRLRESFVKRGFLLLIKQSDKNRYSEKYKSVSKLVSVSNERFERFGLVAPEKAKDFYIDLEKLLQVIIAFAKGGHVAYTKKSQLLKLESQAYKEVVEFIKNDSVTTDMLIDLYLLYRRAEEEKKRTGDGRSPIPYYLIDFFAFYECENRQVRYIENKLNDEKRIDQVIELYRKVTKRYARKYFEKYDVDYNKMIKQPIDYDMVEDLRSMAID